MKKQVKTIGQLRDSSLLFEKKLPAFGFILLLIVFVSGVGVLFWSVNAHKAYMVIANGTVTDSNANYVMPAYSGIIDEYNISEGMLVQKGDVLFTIKSTDYNLQEEQLLLNRSIYEEKVDKLQLLVKSIKDDVNYFESLSDENAFYYNAFEMYKAQMLQNTFDAAVYITYGYTDEQIEKEAEKNRGKIMEIYYSAIQSAEQSINEANEQIAYIDSQLSAIGNGQSEYEIRAFSDGVIHIMADYKQGMVVQAGSAIASITPNNADMMVEAYVSTADMARISEGDTVQMEVDGLLQSVYGNLSGKIVSIDSNMTSLENADEASSIVFKIHIKPDSSYLISKSGNKVNVTNGMTVQARIIYDEVTYFDYVLEKLGLLTR